jgi:Ni/Fe-hydrogenase subunit HybB-like protein
MPRHDHEHAEPVRIRFFGRAGIVLLIFTLAGLAVAAMRFLRGIGAVTHLDDRFPWGIWIAFDVATGVALAAGGFTTAALVYVFHRERYHALVRPALLTALLGYTFVALALLVDLGRYYNIWHPIMPKMWSGHSVLFEVGMCVMAYLTVLYVEFLPLVAERFRGRVDLPGAFRRLNAAVEGLLGLLDRTLGRVLFLFIIAGVVLSCLHQSSLGGLMLIAPTKMHALWFTPILPLLFLLSAFCVGFPMVIFESLLASKGLGRKPEMRLLAPLSRIVPIFLAIYLAFKVGDVVIRGAVPYVFEGSVESLFFILELAGGVVAPLIMLCFRATRRSPNRLLTAAALVIAGVVLNRTNVFLIAYHPPYVTTPYFPSLGEFVVSLGMVAGLVIVYRTIVSVFPVLPAYAVPQRARAAVRRLEAQKAVGVAGAVALAVGLFGATSAGSSGTPHASGASTPVDCAGCHTCAKPTVEEPCLNPCPRELAHRQVSPSIGPDVVSLKELQDLYVPVRFDHRAHATMSDMSGGCENCHHYNEPGQPIAACKACHPAEILHEDISQPGLKGAYHRQCLGCHTEWDRDTACEVCHEKSADGGLEGTMTGKSPRSHYDRIEFVELILLGDKPGGAGIVPLHHKRHADLYVQECSDCHREQRCDACHVNVKVLHPMASVDVALHEICGSACHDTESGACEQCHGRPKDDVFDHASTGWSLHGKHAELLCRRCHAGPGAMVALDANCESCHEVQRWEREAFDHATSGVELDDTHEELGCADCHVAGVDEAASCDSCHDDGRTYMGSWTGGPGEVER